MNKNESIAIFKRAGYTFVGYKDAGWGEKRYHFTHPNIHGEDAYNLRMMRNKARMLDIRMWHEQIKAEYRKGIQEELFTDVEIEERYAVTNAGDFQ